MTKDLNLGIIVEAKTEYTKQLINVMKPFIYEELMKAYNQALEDTENTDEILINFQRNLKKIPKWNSDEIDERNEQILEECPFFNELITAVFVSNVRILTSVRLNKNKRKVKITIPPNTKFVAKVYSNCAKNVYNDPYLFSTNRYPEITNNMIDVYKVIHFSIEDTIRDMLPIQNILESYLNDTLEDEEDHTEDQDIIPPPIDDEDPPIPDEEDPSNDTPGDDMQENEEPQGPQSTAEQPQSAIDNFFDDTKNINVQGKFDNIPVDSQQTMQQPVQPEPVQEPMQPPEKKEQKFFDDVED